MTGPQAQGAQRSAAGGGRGPALALAVEAWRRYGDVELPGYRRINGHQLVAPFLFEPVLSRSL